jgi:hypothetical protein
MLSKEGATLLTGHCYPRNGHLSLICTKVLPGLPTAPGAISVKRNESKNLNHSKEKLAF